MNIFCPHCGKHIDVSINEIEKLEGHYVCPQCLYDIELEGFEQIKPELDSLDGVDNKQEEQVDGNSNDKINTDSQQAPPTTVNDKPAAVPPAYNPASQQQSQSAADAVMRYCKYCGAFLRQGVNFCPKCGRFAKVAPPSYRGNTNVAPQGNRNNAINQPPLGYGQQQPVDPRNRVRQPMASNTRKPANKKQKKSNKSWDSGIFSIMGCLTFTIIIVAIFFILYIVNGEGSIF